MLKEILTTRLEDLVPGTIIKIEYIEYLHECFDGIFAFLAQDLISAKKFCEQFDKKLNQFIVNIKLLEGISLLENNQ
jgi:hypothetical protein